MREVTAGLFVADIQQAGDRARYDAHAITNAIKLTHDPPETGYPPEVTVHDFAMMDGPRNDQVILQRAVATAVEQLAAGGQVMIHCSAGASRSVAVAAATIAVRQDSHFETGLDAIRERLSPTLHPSVRENAVTAVESLREES
jgi:protein-tyrosine phosphatase